MTLDPRLKSEPRMIDVLLELKRDIFLNMNCHALGTITAFDPVHQTVAATINYKKSQIALDPTNTNYVTQLIDYPAIVSAPIVTISGGSAALTMPIAVGDTCLIFFNDRDFDIWWSKADTSKAPNSTRLHSFTDAIALIGVFPSTKSLANYDTTHAVLRNGTTQVGVSATGIKIAQGSTTLKQLLDSTHGILNVLQLLNNSLVLTTGITAANQAAITAAITALNTTIAGVLE